MDVLPAACPLSSVCVSSHTKDMHSNGVVTAVKATLAAAGDTEGVKGDLVATAVIDAFISCHIYDDSYDIPDFETFYIGWHDCNFLISYDGTGINVVQL